MTFTSNKIKCILLLGCIFIFSLATLAQGWEANVIKSINSSDQGSTFWKYTNASAKPVSAGMPFLLFATGLLTKDKDLQLESATMLGGLAITIGTTEALKRIVNRPRPYQRFSGIQYNEFVDGKSFPSGHASVAFYTAASLSINHPKWYVIAPATGWALGVSYGRMYYGQHHPTDLLASAVIGAGSAWISYEAKKRIQRKRKGVKKPL
jgi:undecaprenyl-diphosphatase